jgi:hypothetical protein
MISAPGIGDAVDAHLMALAGGSWHVWKTATLRSAGFPTSLVLQLQSANACAAADAYLARDEEVRRAQLIARDVLTDRIRTATGATRAMLRAARRKVFKGPIRLHDATAEETAVAAAIERRDRAAVDLASAWTSDMAVAYDTLRDIALDPRFRLAAVWQNRRLMSVAIRRLRERHGTPRDLRRTAESVAQLVQRYSVKNDTIGFFGPVAWAALDGDGRSIECRPSSELIATRDVHFEAWCLAAIVDQLNANPAIRPWMAPRLRNGVWMDRDTVYAPLAGAVSVTRAERLLLERCDGVTPARLLAAHASDGEDVLAVLERLVVRQLVEWRLEIPQRLHAERDLRARLDAIGDECLRQQCLDICGPLLTGLSRIAHATGPDDLDDEMEGLEAAFTAVTGRRATRNDGQTYGARGLVYEDCVRACDVNLGRTVLERIGPALSIMLDAAHWASAEWRHEVTAHVRACYARLAATRAGREIDAHRLFASVLSTEPDLPHLVAKVRRAYQARWQAVLGVDGGVSRASYSVDDIAARAAVAFGGAGESGSFGGYFSPDLMIAAADLNAFARGDYHCVLGELHPSNTVLGLGLAAQHPDLDGLRAALTRDTHGTPMIVRHVPNGWRSRLQIVVSPEFWQYEYGSALPDRESAKSMPAGRFVAIDDGERIMLRARDGSVEWDAFHLFAKRLTPFTSDVLSGWLPEAAHLPRITLGPLIIARERWCVRASDLPRTEDDNRSRRFADVRAWANARGMPRQVFCRYPNEKKPCYLDFDAIMFTEIFGKMAAQAPDGSTIVITEMLPRPDETWLVDAQGARYTCELRIVARRQ